MINENGIKENNAEERSRNINCNSKKEREIKKCVVPGVFCLNDKCVNYFENNCTKFFEQNTISIDENGCCSEFIKGENIGYKEEEKVKK